MLASDRRLHLRIVDALRRVEHDGGGRAGLAREVARRAGRVAFCDCVPGVVKVSLVWPSRATASTTTEDGGDEPRADEPPVMPRRAASEAVEKSRHAGPSTGCAPSAC